MSKLQITVAVLAILGTVSVIAVAAGGSPQDRHGTMPTAGVASSAASPNQRAVVGVLARQRVDSDALPVDVARALIRTGPAARHGLEAASSRRVEHAGGDAWVVSGDGRACIVARAPGSQEFATSCALLDQVSDGRLTLEWVYGDDPTSGTSTVIGVVADGVSAVTALDERGGQRRVPVRDNVYRIDGGTTVEVRFDAANGPARVAIR